MDFSGVWTPLITPFGKDGGIDWRGFARLVEFQIEQGVNGLIVGGSTGEFHALTMEERVLQFRRLREISAGRLPTLAGVNALRAADSVQLAVAARDAGIDGLLLGAPPYARPTARELAAHCLAISRDARLPVMLYNFPAKTGADMDADFLRRVLRDRNIQAIKESSGDIARLHLLAGEFPRLQLCCGADDQALEFFAWGATGWVCAAANGLPREVRALFETCVLRGDFAAGRKMMAAFLPLMTILEQGGQFIQCIKYICDSRGHPAGKVRRPLLPLDSRAAGRVDDALKILQTR